MINCDECGDFPEAISGYLPLNSPGEALVVFSGEIHRTVGHQEIHTPGKVILTWRNERAKLNWSVDFDASHEASYLAWRYRHEDNDTQITLDFADIRRADLEVRLSGNGKGWIPGSTIGDETAELDHVIAHWVNLPTIFPAAGLHQHHQDGSCTTWSGRWQTSFGGWTVSIDARPDHRKAYEQAEEEEESFVITHVMDLRRSDGTTFTGAEAADTLAGLQSALSFAVGHWTCPAVPVGYAPSGEIGWSQWYPWRAGRPRSGVGWWTETRSEDLTAFVAAYFDHWSDPRKREPLRFATTSAIVAVETGFVEQRLQTAYSALEMLSWVTEVLEGGMNEGKWCREDADWRLRRLLNAARVDIAIRRNNNNILAQFARANSLGDAPATLPQVRHRLTHPRNPTDLYQTPGLVAEASRLACRYLELTILHRIGYQGHVVNRTKLGRWAGEADPVPWVPQR